MSSRKLRRNLLSIFTLITTFFAAQQIFAQQSQYIDSIEFLGNRRWSDAELLKIIKIRPGDKFDDQKLQADLEKLKKTGDFNVANTKVFTEESLRKGVNVIFEIMEAPLISQIKFENLKYVSSAELLNELNEQNAGISPGDPYQPEKVKKAEEIIKKYLFEKRGLINARVNWAEENVSATNLIISFSIEELSEATNNN